MPNRIQTASQWVMTGLLNALHLQGYADIAEPHLILIGNLDCGTTHAAAVAQRMGVSRQAINRTLRELETQGFLRLEEDPVRRNQKIIAMTASGIELVIHARRALDGLEALLGSRIGQNRSAALREALEMSWGSTEADSPEQVPARPDGH